MAQHLLAAADRFQLIRLRCICEQRLCETVEVRPCCSFCLWGVEWAGWGWFGIQCWSVHCCAAGQQ